MISRNITLALITGLVLLTSFSCTTYYYSTVRPYGSETLQNEDGSFQTKTPRRDLSVTYSFKDLDGKIIYKIHNDSDDPVFVDWSRSVIIAEDHAVQLKNNEAYFQGDANTTTYRFSDSDYAFSSGNISGTVVLPQTDLFIPPHSKIEYSPMELSRILNLEIPAYLYQKRNIGNSEVSFANFTEENTFLKFRSYLTLINDRDKSQIVFEDTFFISEIIKTGSKNILLTRDALQRNDFFYIEDINKSAVNTGWIVAGVAVAGGLILLAPHVHEPPDLSPSF